MGLFRRFSISFSSGSDRSADKSFGSFHPSETEVMALRSVANNYDMLVYTMPSKVIKATRSYLRSLAKGKIPTAASTSSSKSRIPSFFRGSIHRVPSADEIRRFSAGRGLCEEVETVLSLLERLESKEGIVKVQATTPSKSIDKDLSKVTSCSTAPAENQKDPKRQLDN